MGHSTAGIITFGAPLEYIDSGAVFLNCRKPLGELNLTGMVPNHPLTDLLD